MLNTVVAALTARGVLARRRAAVLVLLPLVLLAVAVVFRSAAGRNASQGAQLLDGLALGTVVPLLCVIVGTGSIGPEIEDGSIVYLLSKPLRRASIVVSKLVVAVTVAWLFVVPAVLVAGLLLAGSSSHVAVGYAAATVVACTAYCAVFLLLAVLTRNAVLVGLLYVLIWETTVAGVVPGARALSIRQWSLSVATSVVGSQARPLGVTAAVGLPTGLVLLALVTVASTWYATARLRTLRLTTDE